MASEIPQANQVVLLVVGEIRFRARVELAASLWKNPNWNTPGKTDMTLKRKPNRALAIWCTAFPKQRSKANQTGKGVKFTHRVSKKRARELYQYRKRRKSFLELHTRCQRCGDPATVVHHWAGRRSNLLKVETWRPSCWNCNDWAKQFPKCARLENWIAPIGVYLT